MVGRHCLGIHIGHDRGASVVSDGTLVASVAEERLDRRKHSNSPELPVRSIEAVLSSARISASDLSAVGISYTNVRIGDIVDQLADEVREFLKRPALDVFGAGHHECHALSTYFTSGADEALILVADGAGDLTDTGLEAESLFLGHGGEVALLEHRVQGFPSTRMDRRNSFNLAYMLPDDRKTPISLGRKYEQLTYLIGFGHGQSGKTMGLAAYGEPLFRGQAPATDGIQFDLCFEDALTEVERLWTESGEAWHHFVRRNARGLAASAQVLLEDHMLAIVRSINPEGRYEILCGAGGVFLNCKMNHVLLAQSRFERLHVIPAAGDDGQSVGAAFFAYQRCGGTLRNLRMAHAYFGPRHETAEIVDRLEHFGLTAKRLDPAWLCERLADDLSQGRVVGLLRGASEIGPRALCHRSILADPRRAGMKDCLNYLKGRELFRPFAPVIAAEDQFTYFELEQDSPFMLLATHLKLAYRDALPAVVHADGSSRVQAVGADQDPFVHGLLRAFAARTGHPVLLNTSFNLAGDPIVQSPHDAISTYLASDIDVLVLEDFYVDCKTSRDNVKRSA
jgi:carbamoyltransferase